MHHQSHLSNMKLLELGVCSATFQPCFVILYTPTLTFGMEMFTMSHFMLEMGHLSLILYILRVNVVIFCLC